MSRRNKRPTSTNRPARTVDSASPCVCGRADASYGTCCGPAHDGSAPAATAEALMRSRYSAFVLLDAAYLLRTWSPETRPGRLELDGGTRWLGLEILATSAGSAFHQEGTVEFRAKFREGGAEDEVHERSLFRRDTAGRWVYVGPFEQG